MLPTVAAAAEAEPPARIAPSIAPATTRVTRPLTWRQTDSLVRPVTAAAPSLANEMAGAGAVGTDAADRETPSGVASIGTKRRAATAPSQPPSQVPRRSLEFMSSVALPNL